ncbi:MAG: bifunctional aspartate kinase/homoserine dehydrogenase I [Chlorobi bacterium]|nr:bifunctional aspartate kinase/homoserine dehydrogenase I [Chlorobiota bacterium]
MKILKFGGSSVADAGRIKSVIEILKNYYDSGTRFAVVFSAFGGVTDELIKLAESARDNDKGYYSIYQNLRLRHFKIIDELFGQNNKREKNQTGELFDKLLSVANGINLLRDLSPRTMDLTLSFGERLSCSIISAAMKNRGVDCSYVFSADLIKTTDHFGGAKILFDETNENIKRRFEKNQNVQVITGFIGSTAEGEITTLGRGGSDYTASVLGAALNADEIEIWTDVDGIMTADPRKVNNSIPLKAVTYNEAMELSHFGAKVIHPPTMRPAFEKKIKIRIKNTFNPSFRGTVILEKEPHLKFNAKGISSLDNISMLRIEGSGLISERNATARIFQSLSSENISLLFITQGSSGYSLCVGVLPEYGENAKEVIANELKLELLDGLINEIILEENLALLAVVGEDMRDAPGVSGTIFNSLGKNGINIKAIAQGSSELNVSCVIKNDDLRKALNVVHNAMFLSENKIVNIFLAGPGLVGGSLLNYFRKKMDFLSENLSTTFRLAGLTNSKKMLFDKKGIGFENWKSSLENSGETANADKFIDKMIELDLANTIFIDCTADDSFVYRYKDALESSFSIVTPNKTANSLDYKFYEELRIAAAKHFSQFKYSANVGAALPALDAVKRLVDAGERIHRLEGILSGSLSYVFNSFAAGKKFSEIVEDAKKKGYTEPNPLDDLSGLDAARKLLILLREAGYKLELSDIAVENLMPNAEGTEINQVLKSKDFEFAEKLANAERSGRKLKYVAKFENGKAETGLSMIDSSHPFWTLSGAENIVVINSDNYSDFPLIIRGKGAGAEFTAFGVFGDIIEITKHSG